MKLSKLYSNDPARFGPINFESGLNVVLAEIRLPENKAKDTHNLGKTTLGSVIDFCLLSSPKPNFFLFKHADRFQRLVFFLEIRLLDGSYVTIRRGLEEPTKIGFKRHAEEGRDLSELSQSEWDHFSVPLERSKEILDGLLDLRDLKPWSYRKVIGYLLRTQEDFRDVFHLKKFAGGHSQWKPFLAHVLGFNSELVERHYVKEAACAQKRQEEEIIRRELGGPVSDLSKISGVLLLKRKEAEKKQNVLNEFNFRQFDAESTKVVVDELDQVIGDLNGRRYSLMQNKKRIASSLDEDQILFNPDDASELFREAGVFFEGQLKRDFQQLIAFNRAITDERHGYLVEELGEIDQSLKQVNLELAKQNKLRSEALEFLQDADAFERYRHYGDELITLRAEIIALERQQEYLGKLQNLRAEIRALEEERVHLQAQIEADVVEKTNSADSLFSKVLVHFNEIVETVIDRKALLTVVVNAQGHLEFKAEILDAAGNATSADRGFTYRKLLCVAFDLALLRAHLTGRFARFVFHDGVFESLDDRKKERLLGVIRSYALLGIQHVITLIDSDAPPAPAAGESVFLSEEVVLKLHDEGSDGRLFRMEAW